MNPGNGAGSKPGDRGSPRAADPAADPAGGNRQLSALTGKVAESPTSPVGEPQRRDRPYGRRAPADLLQIASRLTDRDLQIAAWLDEHDVFTTDQLAGLFFSSTITASHRLNSLLHMRWVARFRHCKAGGGSTAWRWVIGPLGAQWHAASRCENPPTSLALRKLWAQLAASPMLTHRLGVHQFFVDLHMHSHRVGPSTAWWSARQTAERFLQRIHPDGAGRLGDTWFFVEHDTGTETIGRLVAKVDAYSALYAAGGPAWPILFHLPSPRREANLHAALRSTRLIVPVATAVHGTHPASPVWRLATGESRGTGRVAITDLPSREATNPLYRTSEA